MNDSPRILIAEDDAHIALAVKIILRRAIHGATITTARDGQEALERLQQEEYDLVLSDWNMPRLTGMELLKQVRCEPRTQQLPFLMLTARSDKDCGESTLANEITSCVSKPFDNDELIAKVVELLGASVTT